MQILWTTFSDDGASVEDSVEIVDGETIVENSVVVDGNGSARVVEDSRDNCQDNGGAGVGNSGTSSASVESSGNGVRDACGIRL